MISPISPSDKEGGGFVVCDIENEPSGAMIDVDTAWRDEKTGEIEHVKHSTWAEWFKWLCGVARDDDRFRVIYAHNGGGWDWLSLVQYLLYEGYAERQSMTAICAGSNMITLTVRVRGKFTLHFCDSLKLLQSSLDKLAEKLLGERKTDLEGKLPHEIKAENPSLYYRYLERDTEILLRVLETALELIRTNIAEIDTFSHTIGSTAMKIFKTIGLSRDISIPWDEETKGFLREGYAGGRVEVFQYGFFENVTVYDINSLYPSVMRDYEVPVSDAGFWTGKFKANYPCGVYRVNFKQRSKHIPAVLLSGGVGAYEGSGVYFSPEIETLLRYDPLCEIDVEVGYVFSDSEKVFESYVNSLYNLRLSDKGGPIDLLCKFLLNSLYGKFGQHAEREKIVAIENFDDLYDMITDGAKVRAINEDSNVYGLSQEVYCGFEHVGIAGQITSAARATLYKGLYDARDDLIYCDTDSVHTRGHLSGDIISEKMGDWKEEFKGDGIYCGKKLYCLRDHNGAEKVRAKGVSCGGRNGASIGWNDFIRMSQGEQIRAEFYRPPSPLDVFHGKQPCTFNPKHRTLRITGDEPQTA